MNSVQINLTLENVKDFVNIAQSFKSSIDIKKGSYTVDGKSIMGIMSLDFSSGVTAKIITSNENELIRFIEEMKQFM